MEFLSKGLNRLDLQDIKVVAFSDDGLVDQSARKSGAVSLLVEGPKGLFGEGCQKKLHMHEMQLGAMEFGRRCMLRGLKRHDVLFWWT